MTEFLIEILQEEIPARMQEKALADLEKLVSDGLKAAGLTFGAVISHVTPRRLVLCVRGLPLAQPDVCEEKKGPPVGAPEAAVAGFLKGSGLTSLDQAEVRELPPKGQFYFAVRQVKGRPTADVLKDIVDAALIALPWPKSMKWGEGSARWVRPIHNIIALFDGEVVPVSFAGVSANANTVGHRFLSPEWTVPVTGYADYAAKMLEGKVMLDAEERANLIKAEAEGLAEKAGLKLKDDPGLLKEVAGLVEWPVVFMGSIDAKFMDVPAEVLTTAMRSHQKYFSCLDKGGKLAPKFIVVANMETDDLGKAIVAGNERVLRARLSDAKFFWDNDLEKPLDSLVPKLSQIVFHAKLGTVAEKVERVMDLAVSIAKTIGADSDQAAHAAHLCKADLVSEMVFEFPEVQGIMGRYYALKGGEKPEVANAIAEHYSPVGPSDACPSALVSVAVALADKIDTLVGFWLIDEKPTGSKDPYALRRAALGVIRLIVENGLRVNLKEVFKDSLNTQPSNARDDYLSKKQHEAERMVVPQSDYRMHDLLSFFADRLKVQQKEKGVRHDLIEAVFALGGEDDLVRLLARVAALSAFLASDDGANLLTAYRRAANIVRIEATKDSQSYAQPVEPNILTQSEEKALFSVLEQVHTEVVTALSREDFSGAMKALARLRQPVDAFFDKVTVNAGEPALRSNRLRLLSSIGSAMGLVAEFSKVEG